MPSEKMQVVRRSKDNNIWAKRLEEDQFSFWVQNLVSKAIQFIGITTSKSNFIQNPE